MNSFKSQESEQKFLINRNLEFFKQQDMISVQKKESFLDSKNQRLRPYNISICGINKSYLLDSSNFYYHKGIDYMGYTLDVCKFILKNELSGSLPSLERKRVFTKISANGSKHILQTHPGALQLAKIENRELYDNMVYILEHINHYCNLSYTIEVESNSFNTHLQFRAKLFKKKQEYFHIVFNHKCIALYDKDSGYLFLSKPLNSIHSDACIHYVVKSFAKTISNTKVDFNKFNFEVNYVNKLCSLYLKEKDKIMKEFIKNDIFYYFKQIQDEDFKNLINKNITLLEAL